VRLTTKRLILRPFVAADLTPFVHLNADPKVMRFFPAPYSKAETQASMVKTAQKWRRDGFGFGAVVLRDTNEFIGMCGLSRPDFPHEHFLHGEVEIGWRLRADQWGKGLASEAARAWLRHGFGKLRLNRISSFASTTNAASLTVMRRIGMVRMEGQDFIHPSLDKNSPLQPMHCYRIDDIAQITTVSH